ncbi:polysaccharide pyruvyl transferase family protein [Pseudactinotalea sp. Z1739]|uniref:polysaccharide pyruvyl transferase family protein n=1 Tax=Pseudactinotalea sp. Z1739 TaxID=3413028 RepID=UPI003C7E95AD
MNVSTDDAVEYPSVEEQRAFLRQRVFEADRKYRILYVGNFFQGPTGIVATLHRSLETLGHTVFKLDTALHKQALDKSSGARGGYAPVFFLPQSIERIFDTFQPQILVTCAGGLVLTSEDSDWLRARGVMSVGLTLSDPDVQESVFPYVPNFDVHATNSKLALDRYRLEGHANTFLFPFGIDRNYVLRTVAEDPTLRADAICIGHAQDRPDRHEVMLHLAEHMDVKTYGSGWPVPDTGSVSGDRLLQAAKAGTFHINFPATRAGYTNVKVGVFESVGAGAVLCTTRFDEMADLFSYDDEIVGYTEASDLADTIKRLLNRPTELEGLRRRAFNRLLSEHLYEHRWISLFRSIEEWLQGIGGDSGWVDRIWRVLSSDHKRPRNVIISGYYGARNRGDDLLLEALLLRIREKVPDANVIAAAVNPLVVERDQGVQAFKRTDPYISDRYASSATALILGPGGLWHDYTIQAGDGVAGIVNGSRLSPSHLAQLPLMVKAYGGEFHVHGMGVGPLEDTSAKASVRLTGLISDSVTVRDEESRALLDGIEKAWPSRPRVSPDVAYTLPMGSPTSAEGHQWLPTEPYIAVNVRPFGKDDDSVATVLNTVLRIASERNWHVLGIPMQPVDEKAMAAWLDSAHPSFTILPVDAPWSVFMDALRRAAGIVAMRLHTNLLAHRAGKMPVGIAYDPKVAAHFKQLKRGSAFVGMPVNGDELHIKLHEAISRSRQSDGTRQLVTSFEERANESLNELCRALSTADVKLPDTGSMVHSPSKDSTTKRQLRIWNPEESLDVRRATVRGYNQFEPEKVVPYQRRDGYTGSTFHLDVRAPKKGDTAEWGLPVRIIDSNAVRVELWIKPKYAEKHKFKGRLLYQVLVDETLLFEQDVTAWQPRNSVWIGKRSSEMTVKVRILALRDCEDWNWGKATAITIEAARVLPWDPPSDQDLVWGASSPGVQVGPNERESPGRALAGEASPDQIINDVDPRVPTGIGGESGASSARPWWKLWG